MFPVMELLVYETSFMRQVSDSVINAYTIKPCHYVLLLRIQDKRMTRYKYADMTYLENPRCGFLMDMTIVKLCTCLSIHTYICMHVRK